jgi:hypothetical protein
MKDFLRAVQDPSSYFEARSNPRKYFDNFQDYSRFHSMGIKPSARNSHTDQQAINTWLMSEERPEPEVAKQQSAPRPPEFTYDAYYEDPGQFQYLLNNTR